MSVQCNTYVMIGALFPYSELFENQYDRLEPYTDSAFKGIHHHNGLCVLPDGMNGEYVAIGKVLAKSENYQGFNAPVLIEFGRAQIAEVGRLLTKEFGDLLGKLELCPVQPLVISHYR